MRALLTIWARSPCCTEDFHVNYAKKNARHYKNGRGKTVAVLQQSCMQALSFLGKARKD